MNLNKHLIEVSQGIHGYEDRISSLKSSLDTISRLLSNNFHSNFSKSISKENISDFSFLSSHISNLNLVKKLQSQLVACVEERERAIQALNFAKSRFKNHLFTSANKFKSKFLKNQSKKNRKIKKTPIRKIRDLHCVFSCCSCFNRDLLLLNPTLNSTKSLKTNKKIQKFALNQSLFSNNIDFESDSSSSGNFCSDSSSECDSVSSDRVLFSEVSYFSQEIDEEKKRGKKTIEIKKNKNRKKSKKMKKKFEENCFEEQIVVHEKLLSEVFCRFCSDIRTSGLIKSQKRDGLDYLKVFMGGELITWMVESSISSTRYEAKVLSSLLLSMDSVFCVLDEPSSQFSKTKNLKHQIRSYSSFSLKDFQQFNTSKKNGKNNTIHSPVLISFFS